MNKWRFSFFSLFLVIGLFSSRYILKTQSLKPAILADVTNSATIVTPSPTPTAGPSSTPTPTSTPSPTATTAPTATPTPSPTPIATLDYRFIVSPPENGSFYMEGEEIKVTIYYRSLIPGSQLNILFNYPLGRINNSPANLTQALSYISGSATTSSEGISANVNLTNFTVGWYIAAINPGSLNQVSFKLKVRKNTSANVVYNDLILNGTYNGIRVPNQTTTILIYGPALSPSPLPTSISQLSPTPGLAPTPTPIEEPEQYFSYSLFGYTSSYANVRLEGIKLLEGTKANKDGYFEFINFQASNRNLEFCLLSIDTENLVSPPLCVPVPIAQINQKYGPYLLPPTLRLAKGEIKTGETDQVSGKTIPGASVNINVFNQPEKTLANLVIKPAWAQTQQKPEVIKATASTDGSFSTNLKSQNAGKKRVFAQSLFNLDKTDNKTPKSVTLTLNVFGALMAILIQLLYLFSKLLNLNTILLLQLGLIIFLLIRRKQLFSWYYLYHHKKTAIVLYRKQSLVKTEKNYCPL